MQNWQAKLFINGEWIGTSEQRTIFNPATQKSVGQVAIANEQHIISAVDAAAKSLPIWRGWTSYERAAVLWKWHSLIEEHSHQIAETMTKEQGKPFQEAIGEVGYANSFISWYAEEGKRLYGDTVPPLSNHKRVIVTKQPVGVVAAITPWNFPAAMITRKISPALAAGCTVVVKPSEFTPMTAYYLVKLAVEAGIPPGVINMVTGNPEQIGEIWMADSRVRKVSFTGSTRVGKILMAQAAQTVKKVSLELGGHAPFIVTNQADVKLAVEQLMLAKFRNAGQTCVSPNRIYVQQDIKDTFTAKLKLALATLKVGNGLDEGVSIGPLINAATKLKAECHIQDACAKGATAFYANVTLPEGGNFVAPTILESVNESMLCMQEETFGPVLPIQGFTTIDEVISRANATPYGLAAYLFTTNINEALSISEALEYGIVGLNDGAPSIAQAPFGGMKESGLGREGGYWGIEEYLETKYISIGMQN